MTERAYQARCDHLCTEAMALSERLAEVEARLERAFDRLRFIEGHLTLGPKK